MNEAQDLSELQSQVALGFDVEAFKGSAVGRYFQLRAQNDVLDALEALKQADPFDSKTISALQCYIQTRECFFAWMIDAIATGQSAAKSIDEQQVDPVDPT